MSEVAMQNTSAIAKPISPLLVYAQKLATTLALVTFFFFVAVSYARIVIKEEIESASRAFSGPVFWDRVEKSLTDFANQKDMPKEKRDAIEASLRKIGERYAPFVRALTDAPK